MTWSRQIKIIAALETAITMFTAWIALISLLFKELADFRLFFLSLGLIFLMQFICTKRNNQYIAMIIPAVVSIPLLLFLFDGAAIIFNLIFVLVNLFMGFKLDEFSVEYDEYKLKIKQGAIILGVMALISLWMEKSTADCIYRFIVNYIIIAVILLRESRAYCYKVRKYDSDAEKINAAGIVKVQQVAIFFKYAIVLISTIVLSTDWILSKSIDVIKVFSKAADFIIGGILDIVRVIFGPILIFVINLFNKLFFSSNFSVRLEDLKAGLKTIFKDPSIDKGSATISDIVFVSNTLKAVAILIIVLFTVDAVYKMKFLRHKNEEYFEEKERIHREKEADKGISRKSNIAALFKKVFRGNITLKEKILSAYRDFEKITYKAQIYKLHMTATELKDKTKLSLGDNTYLDEMTEAYNEVKFSSLEPTENQLRLVTGAVDNIKKQL